VRTSALEVADIVRAAGPSYRRAQAGHLSLAQLKVMSAIQNCRTAGLGGHVDGCDDCGYLRVAYTLVATGIAPNAKAPPREPGSPSARPTFQGSAGANKRIASGRLPYVLGQIGQNRVKLQAGNRMLTLSAKDAKYGFGRLIDLARAEPVAVAKHGRPVLVVMAVEEYERLKVFEIGHVDSRPSTTKKPK